MEREVQAVDSGIYRFDISDPMLCTFILAFLKIFFFPKNLQCMSANMLMILFHFVNVYF